MALALARFPDHSTPSSSPLFAPVDGSVPEIPHRLMYGERATITETVNKNRSKTPTFFWSVSKANCVVVTPWITRAMLQIRYVVDRSGRGLQREASSRHSRCQRRTGRACGPASRLRILIGPSSSLTSNMSDISDISGSGPSRAMSTSAARSQLTYLLPRRPAGPKMRFARSLT